jgi:hypothetical protein
LSDGTLMLTKASYSEYRRIRILPAYSDTRSSEGFAYAI